MVLLGAAVASIFVIVPRLLVTAPVATHSPAGHPAQSRPPAAAPPGAAVPTPSSSPGVGGVVTAAGVALAAHAPPAFAGTCNSFTAAPMAGLVASIICVPDGAGAPAHVEYYQYDTDAHLNAAFSHYAGRLSTTGSCDRGGQRGTYAFPTRPAGGMWACYVDINRTSQMIWTSTGLSILASANDDRKTPLQLSNWFFSASATGPQ